MTGLPGAAALAGMSVVWLLENKPVVGAVLYIVVPRHGLSGADLAGLTGLALPGRRAEVVPELVEVEVAVPHLKPASR